MNKEKIVAKVIKKLSTKKLYHTTNKLVFFLDKPIPNYHGKDTVVLELKNPKNYDIYRLDGYGMEDFNGGKYIEHEDIPAGVEEGDYFTRETISPKDLKVIK